MPTQTKSEILILFDVDGTLTTNRCRIKPDIENFLLNEVKSRAAVGLVSGSDISKITQQMMGEEVLQKFDYVFAENGLVAYKNGVLVSAESISKFMGEEKTQKLINFCLKYMGNLELPRKRGTFIEFRTGMINICPVGRSCSLEDRLEFAKFDKEHEIRVKFRQALMEEFPDFGLKFSIGGQISLDAFPQGWDKRRCLNHLEHEGFKEIHFFGDKTTPGGNDHEIYEDPRTIGHAVTSPEDTVAQLKCVLNIK